MPQPGRVDRAGYRLRRDLAAALHVDATDPRLNPLMDAALLYAEACMTDVTLRLADAAREVSSALSRSACASGQQDTERTE